MPIEAKTIFREQVCVFDIRKLFQSVYPIEVLNIARAMHCQRTPPIEELARQEKNT